MKLNFVSKNNLDYIDHNNNTKSDNDNNDTHGWQLWYFYVQNDQGCQIGAFGEKLFAFFITWPLLNP